MSCSCVEEVNPRGRPSYQGYRPTVGISTITHTTVTLPLSTGKSSPKKAGSRTKVSSRGNRVLHNSSITTNRDRLSLTSRVLHSNNSKLMVEITGLTSSQGVSSVKTRDTKLDPAPIKAKATQINYIPRNLSGAWGSIDPAPRKFLMSSKA